MYFIGFLGGSCVTPVEDVCVVDDVNVYELLSLLDSNMLQSATSYAVSFCGSGLSADTSADLS